MSLDMLSGARADSRAGALDWERLLWWMVPIAVMLLAVVVRLPLLDRPAHIDEFFHVLAAQSLLEDGDLATLDGAPYSRAWFFSYLVAGGFALFGESFVVGRLVPLACGVLLVLALFLVVRRHAGTLAATAAAIPLALDPVSVQLAQFVRFYTLHALLFWIGAWSAYRLVDERRPPGRRLLDAALLISTMLIARHLQPTTIIGVIGVGAWMAAILVYRALTNIPGVPEPLRRRPIAVTAALLVVGAITSVGVSLLIPELRALWGGLSYVPRWAAETADDKRVYLRMLVGSWPLLWLAFPVLVIAALRRTPRAASFALTVFLTVLILHSLAAWKADRYIFYGMPFFFAVCGMGIAALTRPLLEVAAPLLEDVLGTRYRQWARTLSVAALLAAAAFALVQMPGVRATQRWMTQPQPNSPDGTPGTGRPDWAAARDSMLPYVERGAEVLASADVKAVYFLDRVDGFLHLPEPLNPAPGDTISPYTGRPRIFTVDRIRSEFAQNDFSLLIVEDGHWRSVFGIPNDVADEIERSTRQLAIPDEWRMRIFVWENDTIPSH